MELAGTRHDRKSHTLPPLNLRDPSDMNQRGDTKNTSEMTSKKIDIKNTGRVVQKRNRKDRAGKLGILHQPDYDRMSIGSPIPVVLPDEGDDLGVRDVATLPPFPAIKVSSCSELRSTLTLTSTEEMLAPPDAGAASGSLLSLSTPLYRKSTDGRYLQHFTSGNLMTSRSEGDMRTASGKFRGKMSNSGHFDDMTRSRDLVTCQLLKLEIGSAGRPRGGQHGREQPQRLVPIRYSATTVNTPP